MRVTEKLKVVDADTLLSTPLEKTAFIVDGLIPMGVTLLGGSSKIGKSWLMLWLGLQVARIVAHEDNCQHIAADRGIRPERTGGRFRHRDDRLLALGRNLPDRRR